MPCRASRSSRMTTPTLRRMLSSRRSCTQSRKHSAASDLGGDILVESHTLPHGAGWAQLCQHLLTGGQPEELLPAHRRLQAQAPRSRPAQRLLRRHRRLQQQTQGDKQTEGWQGQQLLKWTRKQAHATLSRHAQAALLRKQSMQWVMSMCL